MDRGLVALIGTGLQVVVSGMISAPPSRSLRNGSEFIEHLLMFGNNGLDSLVVDGAGFLWREWRGTSLPYSVAAEHVAALPELIAEFPPDQSAVTAAMELSGDAASYRLASSIIAKAAKAGCFDGPDLNEQISFFFVERLLAFCLPNRDILTDLKPAIISYFEHVEQATADLTSNGVTEMSAGSSELSEWTPAASTGTEAHTFERAV